MDFKDLRDGGYAYKAGDVYPHAGEADEDRVKHLMTATPMRGALLEEVEEPARKEAVQEKPASTPKRKKKE